MATKVKGSLERYNEAAIERAIQESDTDRQRRRKDGDKDLAAACKEAAGWLSHRARGRKIFIPGLSRVS
jgi:hypothetical protein